MTPTKTAGTAKKTTARKSAPKRATVGKPAVDKSPVNKTAARKATARSSATSRYSERPLRKELSSLVNDVRAAVDELAVKGDLATMEGRDRVQAQVVEIENRWLRVKQELGLARSEADSTIEALRSALAKAEDAVRHIFDAALEGVRKP